MSSAPAAPPAAATSSSSNAAAARSETIDLIDLTEDDAVMMIAPQRGATAAAASTAAAAAAASSAVAASSANASVQPAPSGMQVVSMQQQPQQQLFWQPSYTLQPGMQTFSMIPLQPPSLPPLSSVPLAIPTVPPTSLAAPQRPQPPLNLQQQHQPPALYAQLVPSQVLPQPLQSAPSTMHYTSYGPAPSSMDAATYYSSNWSGYVPAYGYAAPFQPTLDESAAAAGSHAPQLYAYAPFYMMHQPVAFSQQSLASLPPGYLASQQMIAPPPATAPAPIRPPVPLPPLAPSMWMTLNAAGSSVAASAAAGSFDSRRLPVATPMQSQGSPTSLAFPPQLSAMPVPAVAPTSLTAYQQTPVTTSNSRKSPYHLHHAYSAPDSSQPARPYHASAYAVGHHPNQHSKRDARGSAYRYHNAGPRPLSPGTAEAAAAGIAAARSHPGFIAAQAIPVPAPAHLAKRKHGEYGSSTAPVLASPVHPSGGVLRQSYLPSPSVSPFSPTLAWPAELASPVVVATKVRAPVSATIVKAHVASSSRDARASSGNHGRSGTRGSDAHAAAAASAPRRTDSSHRRHSTAPPKHKSSQRRSATAMASDDEESEEGSVHVEPRSFSLRARPSRDARPAEPESARPTRQRSTRLAEAESRDPSLRLRRILRHRSAVQQPNEEEEEEEEEQEEAGEEDEKEEQADASDAHSDDRSEPNEKSEKQDEASMSSLPSGENPGPIRAVAEWQSLQRRSSARPLFQPYFPPVDMHVPVHPWMAGLRNPYYRIQRDSAVASTAEELDHQRIGLADVHRYLALAPSADSSAADELALPLPASAERARTSSQSQTALETALTADVQSLMDQSLTQLRARVPQILAANRARIRRSVAQLSAPCAALAALPFSSITRSKVYDMPRSMRISLHQPATAAQLSATAAAAAASAGAASSSTDVPASADATMSSMAEPTAVPFGAAAYGDPDHAHAWRIEQTLYGVPRDEKPASTDERKLREVIHSRVFPISLSVANNPALLGSSGAYISDELSRDHTLPERTHYTTVSRNVPKEDDARLHFVPYFGDAEGVTVDVSLYRMGPHDHSDNDEDIALEDEALQVHTDHVILAVLSKYPAEERVFEALATTLNTLLANSDSPDPKPKRRTHGHSDAQLAKRRKRAREVRRVNREHASSEEDKQESAADKEGSNEDDDAEMKKEAEVDDEPLFTSVRLHKRWVQLSKMHETHHQHQLSLLERYGGDQLEQLAALDDFKRKRRLELQSESTEQKEAPAPATKKTRASVAPSRASRSTAAASSSSAAAAVKPNQPALSPLQELEELDVFHFKPNGAAANAAAASTSSSSSSPGSVPADFNLSRSYSKLFCRRCFVYDCRQHGPSQPRRKDLQLPPDAALNDVEGKLHLQGVSTAPLPEADATLLSQSTTEWPSPMSPHGSRAKSAVRVAPHSGSSLHGKSTSSSPPPHTPQVIMQPFSLKRPCGPHCCKHLTVKTDKSESKEVSTIGEVCTTPTCSRSSAIEWTEVEKMLLRKLIFIFGSAPTVAPTLGSTALPSPSVHAFNFCALANTLGSKTCAEVRAFVVATASRGAQPFLTHQWMLAQEAQRAQQHELENGTADVDAAAQANKKKRKRKNQHTRAALQQRLRAALRRSMNNLPHAFVPCDHPGVSCADAPNCPCARNMTFCEKYCACDSSCAPAASSTAAHPAHANAVGSSICPNRFLGCARTCRGPSARCNTRACPCFAANRECDPDLCGTCEPPSNHGNHAHAHALRADDEDIGAGLRTPSPPAEGGASATRSACLNSSIQYRLHKPLLLGESSIHGWGCFLSATHAEVVAAALATNTGAQLNRQHQNALAAAAAADPSSPASPAAAASSSSAAAAAAAASTNLLPASSFLGVRKHDLITEYFGELISQTEADRRGKIYDRLNRSYLFNLNHEQVVDAARKGNKIKFANHSNNPNCYSKVMLLQGDHRIGIYAKRTIRPGEELLFDYQHEHSGPAPVWFMEKRAAKGTHTTVASRKSTNQSTAAAAAASTHAR